MCVRLQSHVLLAQYKKGTAYVLSNILEVLVVVNFPYTNFPYTRSSSHMYRSALKKIEQMYASIHARASITTAARSQWADAECAW
jgi:hypothetical protein